MDLTQYRRRATTEVRIGGVVIGGGRPVVVQSMTNTDTNDTEASAAQVVRIARAGGRIVRLTAQGPREAENLRHIARRVRELGCDAALVADIHFLPEAAAVAAQYADKVRINPGNYRNDRGQFAALVELCRARGAAIRIGVNHGSLSKRVFDRWGDTPQGMVVSAMEYLRECRRLGFDQVVVSMKSSNTRVMVAAYRLLAETMEAEGMHYPIHLGVTEAGNGLEGRVKSAVGIGALLADGIGDTIRVSLTEAPENEIPVANCSPTTSAAAKAASKCAVRSVTPRPNTAVAAPCRPRSSTANFRPDSASWKPCRPTPRPSCAPRSSTSTTASRWPCAAATRTPRPRRSP